MEKNKGSLAQVTRFCSWHEMIEICTNLFVGSQADYEQKVKFETGWYVVHACKEPYHRQALGYSTRGAPKRHPEYLIARRNNRLILNLVDADDPSFIPKKIIDAALDFVARGLELGKKVLVHCNQGESRSPAIGLLYLTCYTDKIPTTSLDEAEVAFLGIYPPYAPGLGIRGFLQANWKSYCRR